MTWAAQVWRVFRKDMVHMRWMLLGYACCVLALTFQSSLGIALPPNTTSMPLFLAWMTVPLVLVAYAMFLIIVATLDDSPASATAGWRVLPLDASAVLAAKLLIVGSLLVIGVVGQSLRVSHMALDGRQWLFAIGSTATTLLCWLLLALIVASVSRSLIGAVSSFFIGTLALYAISGVAALVLQHTRSGSRVSRVYPDWYGEALWTQWPYVALILICLIAAIALYSRFLRDRWAVGMSVPLCVMLAFAGCGPRIRREAADGLPSSLQIASTSAVTSQTYVADISTKFSISGLAPTDRMVLDTGSLVLVIGGRDTVRAPLGYQGAMMEDGKGRVVRLRVRHPVLKEPSIIPASALAWPISSRAFLATRFDSLSPALLQRLRSAPVEAWVTGIVYVLRGGVSVNASVGAPRRWHRAVSLAVYDSTDASGSQFLSAPMVALTGLHPVGVFESDFAPFGVTALLVREPMREALPLHFRSGAGDMVPLVLPGLGGREIEFVFGAGVAMETDPPPLPAWIHEPSTLMLVGWREIGRYKIATRPTLLQRVIADSL
jgi:hypothetical protein